MVAGLLCAGPLGARPPTDDGRPAPVDAAVWEALAQGQDTFLVRMDGPLASETSAGRSAAVSALRAAGFALLAELDMTLDDLARSGHVARVTRFPASGVLAVRGDVVAAQTLALEPGVAEIRPDSWRRLVDAGTPPDPVRTAHPDREGYAPVASRQSTNPADHVTADRADEVWRRLGVTGEGAVVAVIDTGADWTLPQLVRSYRGRHGTHDHAWFDATGAGADRPFDPNGHGTKVTGVIVGANPDSTAAGLAQGASGLAPGAEWIAVRAFDRSGNGRDSWLLAAAEWVLAPTDRAGGDPRPDLAPDIVNCSWVLENGADPLYRPVLAAWRAAGILPVFAAGNDENGLGTIGSILAPASYPEAVGVGGSDWDGSPWRLSLGGPSFYGGVAPDLLAPVSVWAPVAERELENLLGTSAAAPQVSATAALMLSANPDLTPADLETYLALGARDAGPVGPDDEYGYGLLDAFSSVRAVLDAGRLRGSVTDGLGNPMTAELTVTGPGAAPWVLPAPDGVFDAAVPEGDWRVRVESFAFEPVLREIQIDPAVATRLDVTMNRATTRVTTGSVTDERGRWLIDAQVAVFAEGGCRTALCSDDAPVAVADAGSSGSFQLALPPGSYRLVASAPGHRTVAASTEGLRSWEFTLAHAPRIALVDADADLEERIGPYLDTAIRHAGFRADTWAADGSVGPEWGPFGYDLVVWAHSAGSPGKLDQRLGSARATTALSNFVKGGGRLLASGQRIASLDARGASPVPAAPDFVRDVLRAQFVPGEAPNAAITGAGPFAGLNLQLDLPLGYRWGARLDPDVIAPSVEPGDAVETVLKYADGSGAAVAASGQEGRRLFMAFGPEGAGPPEARAALMGRSIEWLTAPTLAVDAFGFQTTPGSVVSVTVTALGGFVDTEAKVEVTLPPGLEPTGFYIGLDPSPGGAVWEGQLAANEHLLLMLATRVVPGFSGARDQVITARLRSNGAVEEKSALFRPHSAGFDDSAVQMAPGRLQAGESGTLVMSLRNTTDVAVVARAELALPAALVADPASIDATAGTARMDGTTLRWEGTLGGDEVRVTATLRAVGAPSLVQLDALVSGGGVAFTTPSAPVRIGGPRLVADLTVSATEARPGDLVTATLRVANQGASPAQAAASVRAPARLRPLGALEWHAELPPGGETVIPFGMVVTGQGPTGALSITVAITDGLAAPAPEPSPVEAGLIVRAPDLRGSSLLMEPDVFVSGSSAHGTLVLVNTGDAPADATAQVALPPTLWVEPWDVEATAGSWGKMSASVIRWDVNLAPGGGEATLTYDALVARSLPPNSEVAVTAWVGTLSDPPPAPVVSLSTANIANRLDLSASRLEASPARRAAGGRIAFTLTLAANGDTEARDAVVELKLPPALLLDPDSLRGGVEAEPNLGTLVWRGRLGAGSPRRLTWSATVDPQLDVGARAIVRGVLRASGAPDVDLAAVIGVTSGDFTGSTKQMTPRVAAPGQVVHVTLRVVNTGQESRPATVIDALPAGLVYVPRSATASVGSPEWDADSRSLRWVGAIPARSAVEIRFDARMEAMEPVTNVLQITDDDGTRFAAWADVAPRRASVLIPAAARP